MTFAFNHSTTTNFLSVLPKILGVLFIIDGSSLLFRGIVGILFLPHEKSSLSFIALYIAHTIIGGFLYTYYGYAQVLNRPWIHGFLGFFLAFTALIWIIPSFGADYFTGFLGSVTLVWLCLRRYDRSSDTRIGHL